MRWCNGKVIYEDARIFNVKTTLPKESIILDNYLDKKHEVIGAMVIRCDNPCKITLVWQDEEKNKKKQYPKELNDNTTYVFEDLESYIDVIYEGEVGTEFNIALSI